jgi:hypothetical protein
MTKLYAINSTNFSLLAGQGIAQKLTTPKPVQLAWESLSSSSKSDLNIDPWVLLQTERSGVLISQAVVAEPAPQSTDPKKLINLNSEEGEALLKRSLEEGTAKDYASLSIYLTTQDNPGYCGPATLTVVLNALMKDRAPVVYNLGGDDYREFTQKNVLNEATEIVKPAVEIQKSGLTLEQLGAILKTYPGLEVEVQHAADLAVDSFREKIVKNLKEPNNFVLVNYLRKELGQKTGGHISPVAAYDSLTDRFLILDVTRFKYPPVWVSASELYKSTNTVDSDSNKTRGVVFVGLKKKE